MRAPVATIELMYEMATANFSLKANVESTDVALNMLAQATRYVEAQFRAEQIVKVQQQLSEQAEAMRIAASLRKGS